MEEKETCAGRKCLEQGACAALIAAGGQGSRLGWDGPKGCYPITPIRHHTLFQRIAEKVLYASKLYHQPLLLAIMTSSDNDAATKTHFIENNFFGLLPTQVDFFVQPELSFLNDAYEPIVRKDGRSITAPDGNGSIFPQLAKAGILDKWIARGISTISFLPIDNPLALPFDVELIDLQQREEADVALSVVARLDPNESVGLVQQERDTVRIVEYSELTEEERQTNEGMANTSLFCFSMAFVKQAAQIALPIHYARKRILLDGQEVLGWKQERFIFDLFPYALKSVCLQRDREDCFAPLKSAEGKNGPLSVQEALMRYDKKILSRYLERSIEEHSLELSPCFYYPTTQLKQRWLTAAPPLDGYYGELP